MAKRFKTEGMKAYVELIQEKEKEIGCDVFTHQKWSGASYSDRVLNGEFLSSLHWPRVVVAD